MTSPVASDHSFNVYVECGDDKSHREFSQFEGLKPTCAVPRCKGSSSSSSSSSKQPLRCSATRAHKKLMAV